MGYRNYIAEMPKKEYNKIKSLTKEQVWEHYNRVADPDFEDEDPYIGVYEFGKELHEFGKYVDFNLPKKSVKTFFKKKDVEAFFNDENELKVVTPEFLEYVINSYSKKINTYYKELLKDFLTDDKYPRLKDPKDAPATSVYEVLKHVESMAFEWGCSPFSNSFPYNLKNGEAITTSWKYEYNIFELVRIYKNFDWKRNVMFYYGY